MQPIKITVKLLSPVAVVDDWSPSLEGILAYHVLMKHNALSSNPTNEEIEQSYQILEAEIPLKNVNYGGVSCWAVSSPCYLFSSEQVERIRKRWDYQEHRLNWGKRKAKISTSEGPEKSYDLPLFLRNPSVIAWYGVGDIDSTMSILKHCTSLGKKRSVGNGQVEEWIVEAIASDWHLWRDDILMRPYPLELMPKKKPIDMAIREWSLGQPLWHPAFKRICAMPVHTVQNLKC